MRLAMQLGRSLKTVVATTAVLWTASAIGCVGTEEVEGTKPAPYADESSFCEALAAAQCNEEIVSTCYSSSDESLSEDADKCIAVASTKANCVNAIAVVESTAGLTYNKGAAGDCVSKAKSVYADGSVSPQERDDLREVCISVFHGGTGNNGSCTYDADCDTPEGLRCIKKGASATGTCAIPTDVGGGEDCSASSAQCADGFFCDPSVGACLAFSSECNADRPCDQGFICSSTTADGVCVEKKDNTEQCEVGDECISGFCIAPQGQTFGACANNKNYESTSSACDEFR